MPSNAIKLAIDARPRGPRGLIALERVRGMSMLDRSLELALALTDGSITIQARTEELPTLRRELEARTPIRWTFSVDVPQADCAILRTDRIYEPARLIKALRHGNNPETAILWRLDQPHALAVADDELKRRQSYQPLGRYWALQPARRLARVLAPTRIRPNAVTLASAFLMLSASALIAFARITWVTNLLASVAMAMALVLDTADGHLARLQGTTSEFGRWLDAWLDELCDMALHGAIAWAAFLASGSVEWLLLGLVYVMGKYMFLVGTTTSTEEVEEASRESPADGAETFIRNVVHMIGHADVRWHLWIILGALGRLEFALITYAAYFPARTLLGAIGKGMRHA